MTRWSPLFWVRIMAPSPLWLIKLGEWHCVMHVACVCVRACVCVCVCVFSNEQSGRAPLSTTLSRSRDMAPSPLCLIKLGEWHCVMHVACVCVRACVCVCVCVCSNE